MTLAAALEVLGVLPRAAFANTLFMTAMPGRHGVEAAAGLLNAVPGAWHGRLLQEMWQARPSRDAWSYALALSWHGTAHIVVAAAGSDERLAEWFRFADFGGEPVPGVRLVMTGPAELPDELTVFRGGRGDPRDIAAGHSWTPTRAMAAHYAIGKWGTEWRRPGPPAIVRRDVRKCEILAWSPVIGGELVVACPRAPGIEWAVETADLEEIEALFAESQRLLEVSGPAARQALESEAVAAAGWRG